MSKLLRWQGTGTAEQGIGPDGRVLVEVDPSYFRPAEVDVLLGDATKAREQLGWQPTVPFRDLVQLMVRADSASMNAERSERSACVK